MTHSAIAVYEENGILRLREPLSAPLGTEYEVVLIEKDGPDPQEADRLLTEIAAMPNDVPDDGFSGAQHDEVLYGKDSCK